MTATSTRTTRHLGDEELVDLVRFGHDPRHALAQQHLDAGCDPCATSRRIWAAVSAHAAREATYGPPDAAVRVATSYYVLHGPKSLWKRAGRAAQLFYDSILEPLPIGVRSGAPATRLLLYGKAGRLLKLRVQTEDQTESLSLVGQVVDEHKPGRSLRNLPVLVQSSGKTVRHTLTNQSGEFMLELEPLVNLRLVVGMPGSDAIMVALPVTAVIEDEG